jgi:hypothetical protein
MLHRTVNTMNLYHNFVSPFGRRIETGKLFLQDGVFPHHKLNSLPKATATIMFSLHL